jgi:type IV secretion system protein VirB6
MSLPTQPQYDTVILKLYMLLDQVLQTYVYNGYAALAHWVKYPLGAAVVLYIVIMGYSITHGFIKMSMKTFVHAALKIGFIYTAAMNWGWFSNYVVDLVQAFNTHVAAAILSASPASIPGFEPTNINSAMQLTLIKVAKIGTMTWNLGSWHNLSPLFSAGIEWAFGYAIIALAFLEIATAKIMVAVLLTTAPIFISFLLFDRTKGFFEKWVGALAGFSFMFLFVSAVLGLVMTLIQWSIGGMIVNNVIHTSIVGFVPLVICGFLGIKLLMQSASLAQGLGGTVTMGSGAALVGGAIGGFVGGAMSHIQGIRSTKGAVKGIAGWGVNTAMKGADKAYNALKRASSILPRNRR